MKKMFARTLSLVLVLLMVMGVWTAFAAGKAVVNNDKSFPDATFRTFVKRYDKNKNGKLEASEIGKVKWIDLEGKGAINSLKGIEHFTALKNLRVSETSVTSLDLRKNAALDTLTACELPLSDLKITGLKKLADVDVTETELASVDIKGCTKLLKAVRKPFRIEDGEISWMAGKDESFNIDTATSVMNGKKVLRRYAEPKSIKFTKSGITLKKYGDYELMSILTINPSTSVYPIAFSSANENIACVDESGYVEANRKGKTNITAQCGTLKATIKVTVK